MLEQGFGALIHLGEVLVVGGALGVLVTIELRRRALAWTWPALGLPAAFLFYAGGCGLAWWLASTAGYALLWGARWHARDVRDGGDIAQRARQRLTLGDALRRHLARRETRRGRWVTSAGVVVGADARGLPMTIPFGGPSGHHCLVAGATGAGKTVTKAWIAQRHIAAGSAAVVVDPKGDRLLYAALYAAASAAGRPLLVWTPDGPCAYNPYRHGSDTELADKALAGETWTEPHYLRQAQRYLGHVVRTMRAAGIAVTPASLLAHLDPDTLETTSRTVDEHQAGVVQAYLDALGQRQRRDLSGVRDRLAILAESDIAPWLEPREDTHTIDLRQAIDSRAVVADPPRKSVGAEETFERDLVGEGEIAQALLRLSDRVSSRLRAQGISGQTVNVKVRFPSFVTLTRSRTLPREVDSTAPIYATARSLCSRALATQSSRRVRLLGVSVSQLGEWPASEQISLEDQPRWPAAESALDDIRRRFGDDAVRLGSLLT